MFNFKYILPFLLAVLLFSGCEMINGKKKPAEADQKAAALAEEAKKLEKETLQNDETAQAEYQVFKSKWELRIAENNKTISELKQKAANSSEKTRLRLNKEIYELENKNKEIGIKLTNYYYSDYAKWQDFKREFNHDMDELGDALKGLGESSKQ